MFRGFTLSGIHPDFIDKGLYEIEGRQYYESLKLQIQFNVKETTTAKNTLDGTAIQNSWFPQIDSDVFISHSHKDERAAIELSGLLVHEFNLKPFIDSSIWGYANELLREIDNEFCIYFDTEAGRNMYDYEKRNYTTSHVHMMLASAIATMIDRAETLIFLQTPQSLSLEEDLALTTASPWLYFEIGIARNTRIKKPDRYDDEESISVKSLLEAFDPRYKVDLSHFAKLDGDLVSRWIEQFSNNSGSHPLDVLYELRPLPKVR